MNVNVRSDAKERNDGASPSNDDILADGVGAVVTHADGEGAVVTRADGVGAVVTQVFPGCGVLQGVETYDGNHLPHWTMEHALYHVCFRLADSVPEEKLREWLEERNAFAKMRSDGASPSESDMQRLRFLYSEKIEKYLDSGHGECLLRSDGALAVVVATIKHDDGRKYRIHAYGIMPNHVHVIVEILEGVSLQKIVQAWKSVSSHRINAMLGRKGQLWQADYYNHIIRTLREYGFQMDYVFKNNCLESWRLPEGNDGEGAVATRADGEGAVATHADGEGAVVTHADGVGLLRDARRVAILSASLLSIATARAADNAYTNHAGNVVSGVVVALDARTATISNEMETVALPLSIFPEPERRRIAADFVLRHGGAGKIDILRVPAEVKRAVDGAEKAIARSRKRAAKGICSKEESDALCAESEAALRAYLDKQMKSGTIPPTERMALGH